MWRQLNRLLRYSNFGRDKFPIFSLDHEKTCSTTTVLELRTGHAPYFFSTMRRLVRLLRYSNPGWDQLPIFSRPWEDLFDYYRTWTPDGTRSLSFSSIRRFTRLQQYSISNGTCSLSSKRIFTSMSWQLSTTTVLDLKRDNISRRDTHPQDGQYKSSLRKNLSNSLTKKSYSHGKKKIQYTLLAY